MILFKSRKIRNLLDKYKSPDIKEKNREIVSELEKFGTEAIQYIIEFFQQRKLPSSKAQYLLEKLSDDSSQEIFIDLIGDPFDEVRRVAKEIIRQRWTRTASPLLVDCLSSADIYKRNNAVELLMHFQDKSCEQSLISLFNTVGAEQKKCIIKILSSFKTNSGNRLVVSALNDSDCHVRVVALKQIGKLKLKSGVEQLIEKLDEREPQVKQLAIEALGNIGDNRATRPLLGLLKDDDLMVRQAAVDSLIEIADVDVVSDLLSLLRSDDVNVRRCAVEVLRNMKDPRTSAALMQAIKDSDWWVRQIATDSLSSLKSGNIVEGFIGLTKDSDENIRRCAVEFFIQVPSEDAYDSLVELLHDPDWWVRDKAIIAVSQLKKPEVIPLLLSLADDQAVCRSIPPALAEIGDDEAFRQLTGLLYTGRKQLRLEALKVLVESKGQGCVDDLKKCLSDPEKEIRTQAILALKELTGQIFSEEAPDAASSSLIQTSVAPGMTLTEAIVVIDLCNSTDIISRYGNTFSLNLMKKLSSIVEPIARKEKCQFTKGTGDGFLLTFPKAENAIAFSVDVLNTMQKVNEKADENQRINLRFAINIGETKVDEKGDRIGVAVNMAFRVEGLKPEAAIAVEDCMPQDEVPRENRILITENLAQEALKIEALASRLIGLFELKGIPGLHRIFYLPHQ
ncbi:MAG: HEAT repeat domain-containing protein [Desulfobulbaceae bacterium]|nr:HEAT repeat domain-containing protein [Desulfobulbaceae bacterium]